MSYHNFATCLRSHRRQRNLLQKEVASRARISERALRDWEKGKASPGRWELESLLTALELTPPERLQALALVPTQRGADLVQQEVREALREDIGPLPVLGDLLRAMRLRRSMPQEQLAAALGVALSTVFRWETSRAFPSEENIVRLCGVLGAYPEERMALLQRRLDGWSDVAHGTLERCVEQIEQLGQRINFNHDALIDLQALALKRQLWLLANDSEAAIRLFACTQVYHAVWLEIQSRDEEAFECVQRSLQALVGRRADDRFWQSGLSVAAEYMMRKEDAGSALDQLAYWCRSFPEERQTTVWCDMAEYAAYAGQIHEAKAYLARARETLPYNLEAERMAADYLPIAESRILRSFGRPAEALERLPSLYGPTSSAALRASRLVLWAETLFEAGERDEAQRHLEEARVVMGSHSMPRLRQQMETLAARF